jgi:flagellar protein FlaG
MVMNVYNVTSGTTAQGSGAPSANITAAGGLPSRQGVATAGQAADQGPGQTTDVASDATLKAAVLQLNDYVQNVQRALEFSVDEQTGATVITVRDADTHQVIRQIPSKEMLAVAQELSKHGAQVGGAGLLVREKA